MLRFLSAPFRFLFGPRPETDMKDRLWLAGRFLMIPLLPFFFIIVVLLFLALLQALGVY